MKLSKNLSNEKAAEISQQHYFETLKHLTTLSSASVLLLATFLEKLFTKPEWAWLIGLTFCLFILSMISSVMLMFWQGLGSEEDLGALSKEGFRAYLITGIFSVWCFLGGMISLMVFALKNFY